MSYILEALAKSEHERQQQAVPDLQTQHTLYPGAGRAKSRRQRSTARRYRPAILAGLLLLLTVWLFRDQIPVALEIKITRQSDLSATPGPTTAPDPENRSGPAGKTHPDQSAAPTTTESAHEKTELQPELDTAATEAPSPHTEGKTEGIDEQPPASSPDQAVKTASTPTTVTLQPVPILLADTTEPDEVPVLQSLPFVEELPASVRDDLPKLRFAGHTFSANPKNRLIIINNAIKKEGDPVEQGVRLEAITWDGVILTFKGIRFQMITTTN